MRAGTYTHKINNKNFKCHLKSINYNLLLIDINLLLPIYRKTIIIQCKTVSWLGLDVFPRSLMSQVNEHDNPWSFILLSDLSRKCPAHSSAWLLAYFKWNWLYKLYCWFYFFEIKANTLSVTKSILSSEFVITVILKYFKHIENILILDMQSHFPRNITTP